MASPRVLIFLADNGNDPTEIAVPWSILVANDITVEFATETGLESHCDPRMLSGPVGAIMGATASAKALYNDLTKLSSWQHPHSWTSSGFSLKGYAGILLPGGHDKPMRQYLESASLQAHLASFFPLTKRGSTGSKVVGAICHGVLALARAKGAEGKSVLWDATTTTLPVHMERFAYFSTAPILGTYYRTYPEYTASEVQSLLSSPAQYKSGGILNVKPFTMVDPTYYYVSSRFPGDAQAFGEAYVALLREAQGR
ncbi:hypothetical protein FRB94_010572 [Tulasnella sp. JGI-2019a]|nr:hypothetical protein FRB94_010572 [Tulasnella sp. JGI-2019a]KAG9017876.1 hypothetical protein FRB93_004687 [Tulasnella sp. JGI-2019a]KAG9039100.1 hypothetical protein FRB95_012811 [Tulasnella sp. JGI-2019a]